MAIYRLLQNASYGPHETALMTSAYEAALIQLAIPRDDPRTEIIASRILHSVKGGETDATRIMQIALRGLSETPDSESA